LITSCSSIRRSSSSSSSGGDGVGGVTRGRVVAINRTVSRSDHVHDVLVRNPFIGGQLEVGATQWRRGRDGAADTGLMERAEWTEPGSMTDSY